MPDRRGDVRRSQEVVVEYADMEKLGNSVSESRSGTEGITEIPTRRDTVKGFTAVIFQHETDHLDGVLYIDRL